MSARPLLLPPQQRALLAEFESLHEQWRLASEAAARAECEVAQLFRAGDGSAAPADDAVRQALQLRLRAQELHERAMQLVRDAPI